MYKIYSVSYTHLDVYKRQGLMRISNVLEHIVTYLCSALTEATPARKGEGWKDALGCLRGFPLQYFICQVLKYVLKRFVHFNACFAFSFCNYDYHMICF